MVAPPLPVPTVQDYMSYLATDENDDYATALATYIIEMAAPTAAPAPDKVYWESTPRAATPPSPSYFG